MIKKIINLILLTIILFLGINIYCYDKVYAADTVDEVMNGANNFLTTGSEVVIDEGTLHTTSNFIFNLLLGIAIVVAVIVGMVIGIQYMMAGINEKAKIKEALLPYVVGCTVVFGAFGIWRLLVNILSEW